MDVTSIRNQFIILLDALRNLGRGTVKFLSGVSLTGWIVLTTALIGATVCILLYSRDRKRAAAWGVLATFSTILIILFMTRMLLAYKVAGVTDVGLFILIWTSRRPAALFNSEGKRLGGAYIRHGQADISRAKRKAEAVTVVIRKEYARRHIGETIRFIAGDQITGSVTIPPGTREVRVQI